MQLQFLLLIKTVERNWILSQNEKNSWKENFLRVQNDISMNIQGIDTKIYFFSLGVNLILFFCAPVAQRIRASDYGSEGREFESLQARLKNM